MPTKLENGQKAEIEKLKREREKAGKPNPHPRTSVPAGKFRCQQPPGLVYR